MPVVDRPTLQVAVDRANRISIQTMPCVYRSRSLTACTYERYSTAYDLLLILSGSFPSSYSQTDSPTAPIVQTQRLGAGDDNVVNSSPQKHTILGKHPREDTPDDSSSVTLMPTPSFDMMNVCPCTLSGHPCKVGGICRRMPICIVSSRLTAPFWTKTYCLRRKTHAS